MSDSTQLNAQQKKSEVTTPSAWGDILSAIGAIWEFINKHPSGLILALILTAVGVSVWMVSSAYRNRTVVLYTSTKFGDSSRIGEEIREHFVRYPPSSIVNYRIELRPSEGFKENRDRVTASAGEEIVIGFDQDGFNPSSNIRTLIPLGEMYLHAITLKSHVEEADKKISQPRNAFSWSPFSADRPPKRQVTLLDMVNHFRNGKRSITKSPVIYIGPRGSGTRQLAEVVLAHYGLDRELYDAGDHFGWAAAYQKLLLTEIDIVLDGADLGSPLITDLAKREKFQLISLDKVDSITAGETRYLRKRPIPSGSYGINSEFCQHNIDTVATQRLVVCHRDLPTFDAYYLTAGIREALRSSVPSIPWKGESPAEVKTELVSSLHPGADDYVRERKPHVWLVGVVERHWYTVLSFLLGGVFLAVRAIRRRILRSGDGEQVAVGDGENPPPTGTGQTESKPDSSPDTTPPTELRPAIRLFLSQCDDVEGKVDRLDEASKLGERKKLSTELDRLWQEAGQLQRRFGTEAEVVLPKVVLLSKLKAKLSDPPTPTTGPPQTAPDSTAPDPG